MGISLFCIDFNSFGFGYSMIEIEIKDLRINNEMADKILRKAYLKGYLGKCEDVTNGCDFFRYDPVKSVVYFHIVDPMFWVSLTLNETIDCITDILAREVYKEQKISRGKIRRKR
jgi:hypothetical protein